MSIERIRETFERIYTLPPAATWNASEVRYEADRLEPHHIKSEVENCTMMFHAFMAGMGAAINGPGHPAEIARLERQNQELAEALQEEVEFRLNVERQNRELTLEEAPQPGTT